MWLGDIEIWRTSTAEPKPHPGIRWTFWKDSSPYLALWEKPQKLIFDLGNLINDEYTGSFNATLTATYSTHMRVDPTMAEPAHQILPISAGRAQDNQGSQWNYPRENAEAALEFPKDVAQAVVTIAATGQGDEEFWWTNVPDSGIDTFGKPPLLGRGSFREVRLSIDGRIAGLSWPFPTVFTGGISPPLHRPIVGLQAFDLREHEIDITPWLGVLCDGKKHTFGLKVVGADEAPANDYWVLSAKAFLWKHWQGLAATGNAPNVSLSEPNYDARQNATRNKFLRYDQTVSRELSVSGVVGWGQSSAPHIWHQRFEMRNQGFLTDSGLSQNVTADYRGYDAAWIIDPIAHFAWPPSYSVNYSYPISLSTKQGAPNAQYSLTLDAELTQQMHLEFHGDAVLPDGLNSLYWLQGLLKSSVGVFVNTVKSGKAFYWQKLGGKLSGGFGHSSQDFASGLLISEREEAEKSLLPLYTRVVSAVNDTITGDREWQYGTEYKSNAADGKAVPQDNQLNTFAPKFIGGTRRQKLRPDSVSVLTTEHGKNTKNRQARGRQSPMGPMFKENRL